MSDLEKKSIEMSEEINDTNEIIEEKPKFKLNPEIKGMIGLFVIIFILGLIIAISLGKFEQWFGVDPFTGAKITNKIVYIGGIFLPLLFLLVIAEIFRIEINKY